MRFARIGVLVCFLVLSIPAWAQQANSTTTQPTSDPQAVAVVQAAITALGGATAISQSQVWDLQGQVDGPIDIGNRTETINLQIPIATITVNGASRPAHKFVSPSHFLPVLVGAILVQEFQDSNLEMHFDGPSTLGSKSVTVVRFLAADSKAITQIWAFDAATGLPARVFFESPAQIGQTSSYRSLVDFSDYRNVLGTLYPFNVVTYQEGQLPETLNLQSLVPSAASSLSPTATTQGGAK